MGTKEELGIAPVGATVNWACWETLGDTWLPRALGADPVPGSTWLAGRG